VPRDEVLRRQRRRQARQWVRLGGASVVVLGLVLVATLLPVGVWMQALVQWIRDAGALGVAVYAIAYVLAAVFLIPGSVLTLGAGFAYGPILGTLLVSPVSVTAATVAFWLGRTTARDWIRSRISRDRRFAAIDKAIAREGLKIVLLLRLSPIFPFNVLNYALGLTGVRLRDYVLGSFVGMLPGTVLYVYLGSLVTTAAALGGAEQRPATPRGWYWIGLAATVVVVVVITRLARRALRAALDGASGTEATSGA